MKLKYITIFFLLVQTNPIFTQQNQQQIRLLDKKNALPISGASFEYGNQRGVSDDEGIIRFQYLEGNTMKLSHVGYGSWTLNEQELQQLIKQEIYYRRSLTVDLIPVTIIAVRPQAQPEEKIGVDYEERMEHDGAVLLNQVLSFNSIRKSGNYGFDPVYRGFKYDQLNVVLNGAQSATAACPNRMDPPTSQMAPNMIDRIEILKGPHALRFGTGFGATINFIPSKLRFSSNPDIYGRISAGYENNGNMARGESQIGLSGERYDFSLFGSWSQGDDYRTGSKDPVQADFKRGSFGANLGLKISINQQLRISALYNRARDADFPALPMDLREDDTWMLNARHDIQLYGNNLKSWNTTVFGSFVEHFMDNLLKPLNPRMMNAETMAQTRNYGGRTESVWRLGKGTFYSGADLRVERAKGTRVREFLMGPNAGNSVEDDAWQDGQIIKIGLFGEYHLETSSLNYVFSGRLEFNNSDINDASDEFLKVYAETGISQINPGVSVGILRSFKEHLKSGFWLGRVQRSGSLIERYINYFPVGQDPFEMLGNPKLKPEVNNQTDLTIEWSNMKTAINLDVFASYLQDYISSAIDTSLSPRLTNSPGVRQFVNINETFKTGFEATWIQQLPLKIKNQMGIAYTYGQDIERDEPLPEIPPLEIRNVVSGSYIKDKLKPEIVVRYVMKQSRVSRVFGENITPDFVLLDLKVGYAIFDNLKLNAGIKNVFNKTYYEHLNRIAQSTGSQIFAPGRSLYLNANFLF